MTEIHPTDSKQMLYIILLHQTTQIILYSLIPTSPQSSPAQLTAGLSNLEQDLLYLRIDWNWVLDQPVLINADDGGNALVLEL